MKRQLTIQNIYRIYINKRFSIDFKMGFLPSFSLFIFFISFIFFSNICVAQDIHLSHIHASPTYYNPAMTAVFNGDLRLIGNYRGQWNTITKGYKSLIASGDMKLNAGIGLRDNIGVGFQAISDKAGDLDFTNMSFGIALSYLKALNDDGDHIISMGIHNGIVQNRLDISKIRIFEQDPFLSSSDFINHVNYWDLSAGIAWFYPMWKEDYIYLGGSVFHLNKAFAGFSDGRVESKSGSFLTPKYVLHGGGSFQLSHFTTLIPNFIMVDQFPHREFLMGSFLKITPEPRTYLQPEYAFYGGLWVRWSYKDGHFTKDALVASVRYDYMNMIYSISFDINISNLAKANSGFGGPELSIIKYFDFNRPERMRTRVKCPDM